MWCFLSLVLCSIEPQHTSETKEAKTGSQDVSIKIVCSVASTTNSVS